MLAVVSIDSQVKLAIQVVDLNQLPGDGVRRVLGRELTLDEREPRQRLVRPIVRAKLQRIGGVQARNGETQTKDGESCEVGQGVVS